MTGYAHDPSASRRLVGFILFVIGVTLTISLFYVKTRAQSAKENVVMLERSIVEQEAAIAVLKAELAVLESPERLSALVRDTLGNVPIKTERTLTQEEFIRVIPLRDIDPKRGSGE